MICIDINTIPVNHDCQSVWLVATLENFRSFVAATHAYLIRPSILCKSQYTVYGNASILIP